ncbi:restriction endonuclease subunit S [Mycobacterium sp.]|uniref:restriction endonuclease subunit S n=1 Tax=Mycobacterium sp. TaxID=1785 RepID=UPI000CBE090B|nr:restriction endonuclease subunit S [Mycobacterium sp.]PJE02324.1 MAG: restriction endonuclease subunit S [Mycobacterium sp.]
MSLNLDKSTWKRVTFGDVVKNLNVAVKDPVAEGIDRIIAMEHLDPGELKINRWGDLEDGTTFTRRVRPSQTLFGKRRAYQRKAAYAEFDAVCSGDILVFEADPQKMLPEFLPFLVQSDGFYGHALGTSAGSLSPRTNWRDLANFEFDLPPLDEQLRIANLLWSIVRHQLAVAEMAAGLMQVRAVWRSALFAEPSVTARLEERAEITLGRQRAPQHATGDHMRDYVRSANVAGGHVSLNDIKQMNFTPTEQRKFRLRPGDVLVSEGTASARELGSSAMWEPVDPDAEMYFQKTLLRLRAVDGLSTPTLLREWAQWAQESGAFVKVATGTGILHITGVRCAAMPFPVLTYAEQQALGERAAQLSDAALSIQCEMDEGMRLRGALIDEVFGAN